MPVISAYVFLSVTKIVNTKKIIGEYLKDSHTQKVLPII